MTAPVTDLSIKFANEIIDLALLIGILKQKKIFVTSSNEVELEIQIS